MTGFDAVALLEETFALWKTHWHFYLAERANNLEWLVLRGSVVERFPEWNPRKFALYGMLLGEAFKKQRRIFQLIEAGAEDGEESAEK